jgi:hypothetical protein
VEILTHILGKRYWSFLEQYQKFIEASGSGIEQQLNTAAWILAKKEHTYHDQ